MREKMVSTYQLSGWMINRSHLFPVGAPSLPSPPPKLNSLPNTAAKFLFHDPLLETSTSHPSSSDSSPPLLPPLLMIFLDLYFLFSWQSEDIKHWQLRLYSILSRWLHQWGRGLSSIITLTLLGACIMSEFTAVRLWRPRESVDFNVRSVKASGIWCCFPYFHL